MHSCILGSIAKKLTEIFRGHYTTPKTLLWQSAVCFTTKLMIIYLVSGVQCHKILNSFSLLGGYNGDKLGWKRPLRSSIHRQPNTHWDSPIQPLSPGLMAANSYWEYGLVTKNLSGGPSNQGTLHHGQRHILKLVHPQGIAQSSSICSGCWRKVRGWLYLFIAECQFGCA